MVRTTLATTDIRRCDAAPRNVRSWLARATGVVLSAAITAFASCGDAAVIDRLEIVNRTPFDVEVRVTDNERSSWLILGRAEHEASTSKEEVADIGDTWVFEFSYSGRRLGESELTRAELERNRWRVQVPTEVADRMRRAGFEPASDR